MTESIASRSARARRNQKPRHTPTPSDLDDMSLGEDATTELMGESTLAHPPLGDHDQTAEVERLAHARPYPPDEELLLAYRVLASAGISTPSSEDDDDSDGPALDEELAVHRMH